MPTPEDVLARRRELTELVREAAVAGRAGELADAALRAARVLAAGGAVWCCGLGRAGRRCAGLTASILADGGGLDRPALPAILLEADAAERAPALVGAGSFLLLISPDAARAEAPAADARARGVETATLSAPLPPVAETAAPRVRSDLERIALAEAADAFCRLVEHFLFENAPALFPAEDEEP